MEFSVINKYNDGASQKKSRRSRPWNQWMQKHTQYQLELYTCTAGQVQNTRKRGFFNSNPNRSYKYKESKQRELLYRHQCQAQPSYLYSREEQARCRGTPCDPRRDQLHHKYQEIAGNAGGEELHHGSRLRKATAQLLKQNIKTSKRNRSLKLWFVAKK